MAFAVQVFLNRFTVNKLHLINAIIIMHTLDAIFTSQGYQVHFVPYAHAYGTK